MSQNCGFMSHLWFYDAGVVLCRRCGFMSQNCGFMSQVWFYVAELWFYVA